MVKGERNRSRAVFLGQVVRVTSTKWTFRIERVWKGKLGAEVSLLRPKPRRNADGDVVVSTCDFREMFKRGERYVVFAFGATNDDLRGGDACTHTQQVLRSDDTIIKVLDELGRTHPVAEDRAESRTGPEP